MPHPDRGARGRDPRRALERALRREAREVLSALDALANRPGAREAQDRVCRAVGRVRDTGALARMVCGTDPAAQLAKGLEVLCTRAAEARLLRTEVALVGELGRQDAYARLVASQLEVRLRDHRDTVRFLAERIHGPTVRELAAPLRAGLPASAERAPDVRTLPARLLGRGRALGRSALSHRSSRALRTLRGRVARVCLAWEVLGRSLGDHAPGPAQRERVAALLKELDTARLWDALSETARDFARTAPLRGHKGLLRAVEAQRTQAYRTARETFQALAADGLLPGVGPRRRASART